MTGIRPLIKPYTDIVATAANLFDITYAEADEFMYMRLRELDLDELDVVIYTNWASHNALTQRELSVHLGIGIEHLKWRMQNLKRIFPHLFCSGLTQPPLVD